MPTFRIFWSLIAGLVLACGSESHAPKPPDLVAAFTNLPLPPDPELISQTGSADALQLTLHSSGDMDRILEYYRVILSTGNWRLVSDTKSPAGSVALYAEQLPTDVGSDLEAEGSVGNDGSDDWRGCSEGYNQTKQMIPGQDVLMLSQSVSSISTKRSHRG